MTTDPCNGQVPVDCLAVLPRLEVAALPAFGMVHNFVLSIEGGPLVSLTSAVNVLAALTGSASGGLTSALVLSAKPIDSSP
jgi:H+/gluconate symporter-like permease